MHFPKDKQRSRSVSPEGVAIPPELLTCGIQLQELNRRGRNGEVNVARVC